MEQYLQKGEQILLKAGIKHIKTSVGHLQGIGKVES